MTGMLSIGLLTDGRPLGRSRLQARTVDFVRRCMVGRPHWVSQFEIRFITACASVVVLDWPALEGILIPETTSAEKLSL